MDAAFRWVSVGHKLCHSFGSRLFTLLFSSCLAACLHGGCQIEDPEEQNKPVSVDVCVEMTKD